MLENKEQDRNTSREVEIEWSTREIMNISNGRFITKLLLVAKKNTILVVYNRLLKKTYFVATTEGTLAERLV